MNLHTDLQSAGEPAGRHSPPSLQQWQREMRRGQGAALQGQLLLALASYQQAVALARSLVADPPDGQADDCVAALVVAHLNLADVLADAGSIELAAVQRCHVHEALMQLLQSGDSTHDELQRAALRHSRETHACLMLHLSEHGSDPAILRALRKGCMALAVGPVH